jgi:hypothetical protein
MERALTISLCCLVAIAAFASALTAQEPAAPPVTNGDVLGVFLDCHTHCDFDHFRREIPFVNYVRDRQDADVHVLVTSRQAGAGTEFIFNYIGLEAFASREDTLTYVSSTTDTFDEIRDGLTRTLQLGLMPYVANTSVADRIRISYLAPDARDVRQQPADDPWNFWVFRVGGGGSFRAETSQRSFSVNGSFRANRVTDNWKIRFFSNGRYSEDRFDLEEDSTFVSTVATYRFETSAVRSLGPHWAVGGEVSVAKSVRFNQDVAVRVSPAVEFSVFPYEESTRRALVFFYTVGVAHFNYEEITIFDKTVETRVQQNLDISAEAVQPWGSLGAELEFASFLHDLSLHRLELGAGVSIRVVRGLNFNTGGSIARVKDQIFLSGAGIPEEDILLRRRQLGTDFFVRANFGFSYTFGSIYNNIVNPRMERF